MLRQQRLHVSTPSSNTQTACQKDLVWRRRSHLQSRCRSSSVEFGRPSTIVAIRMMPAPIPMQRSGPRTTFWSRDPTFVGRRARLATVKVLAPDELTRHRIHPETLSTGVRPYERTSEPARQPEPTKWCHGSPDGHAWSLQARWLPPLSPATMAFPGVGSAGGHLPYASTVPGSHRAGPCDPGGAPYGRTEYGRPIECAKRIPGTGKGF